MGRDTGRTADLKFPVATQHSREAIIEERSFSQQHPHQRRDLLEAIFTEVYGSHVASLSEVEKVCMASGLQVFQTERMYITEGSFCLMLKGFE